MDASVQTAIVSGAAAFVVMVGTQWSASRMRKGVDATTIGKTGLEVVPEMGERMLEALSMVNELSEAVATTRQQLSEARSEAADIRTELAKAKAEVAELRHENALLKEERDAYRRALHGED